MNDREHDLARLAEAVSDGAAVDWETETSGHPDLGPILQQFRLLESLAAAHRGDPGETAGRESQNRAAREATADVGPKSWGPLRLLEGVGRGGFGEIYRAFDPALQREVALKLLRPDRFRGEADLRRFLEEGRRLARVHHPNVLGVLGVDWHEGRLGIWTDFLRGQTLEALLGQQGPFGAAEAAQIGIELCRALAAVHAAGLVHRDVKASNVMREQGGRIVLMDFGTADEALGSSSASGGDPISGTPLTMAPEVLRGESAGPVADLYGLGVLLYRLVSGRFPVEASSPAELKTAHERGERAPLLDRRPDLPAEFVSIVERALDSDPGRRYASAGAMEWALAEWRGAPAASGAATTSREDRRRPLWLAAAAIVLGAFLAIALWPRGTAHVPATQAPAQVTRPDASMGGAPSGTASVAPLTASAALLRDRDGHEEALAPGDRVKPGDGLLLEIQGSEPIYVYVLDEDTRGSVYVLFPAPGLDLGNPLQANVLHRLPGTLKGEPHDWQVTSAGGQETVIVIASREPLPALEQEISAFPRATPGRPVVYGELAPGAIGALRGIGGMPRASDASGARRRLSQVLRSGLAPAGGSAPWIWQIQLENHGD